MGSFRCLNSQVPLSAGQHHRSKLVTKLGWWDPYGSRRCWIVPNHDSKMKNYSYVTRVSNNNQDNVVFDNVASLVPDFPRLFDRPDLLPKQFTSPLSGFDVNAETKLLFPDIVNIDNFYTAAIAIAFVVAFISFEGIELLSSYQSEKVFEKLAEKSSRRESSINNPEKDNEEEKEEYIKRERKRGLGWLAIVTAIAVWSTGILNNPNPLSP